MVTCKIGHEDMVARAAQVFGAFCEVTQVIGGELRCTVEHIAHQHLDHNHEVIVLNTQVALELVYRQIEQVKVGIGSLPIFSAQNHDVLLIQEVFALVCQSVGVENRCFGKTFSNKVKVDEPFVHTLENRPVHLHQIDLYRSGRKIVGQRFDHRLHIPGIIICRENEVDAQYAQYFLLQ